MPTKTKKSAKQEYSWEAKEFPYYRKNFAWYITFVAVVILLVGFEFVMGDIFGGVSLAIVGALAMFFAGLRPKTIIVSVTSKGVHMDDLFIPYSKMRHYWFVENDKHKTLNIETRAFLQKILVLELHDEDPEEVRTILKEFLPELDETEPTMAQKIMHKIRF